MEDKNYCSDSPIFEKEHDKFSRWGFSQRIAQVISKRTNPSSIVIGLYGIWGDGKTSVLNFIAKALDTDKNVICINFNPWRFGTEEELLTGFFFDIAKALDTELIKTGDKLKDLVKKAAPGAGALLGAKGAGDAFSSFISELDVYELKKRIESELEKAQKRVLILIDDVDRLEKTEIHALFRLVKLTADFRYTSYLLAFDKNIVAASLQERYSSFAENAGEAFIEKIIQIPLHLPAVEKQVLREFCFEGVDEALSIAGITLSEAQVQDFIRNFSLAFDSCLTTPRKARLYGNSLMFSLPILKGEVNPVDLMLLEGIRIFCPPLYEVLRVNKVLFAEVLSISVYSDNNDKKEDIKTLINKALDEGKNINKDGFIELLKNMFPTLKGVYGNTVFGSDWQKKWNDGQRICSENYYSRYFTYSIPNGDIPDQDIPVLIEKIRAWGKCMDIETNPLNEYVNSNVLETLIRKLRHKSGELNEPASAALAMALSQKCDEIPNPDVLYSWTTPFSQAAMLIGDIVQNVPKSDRVNLVKCCISTAPLMEFKIGILKWLKQEDEAKPEVDTFSEAPCVRIVVASVFHKNITGSGKLDISEALS